MNTLGFNHSNQFNTAYSNQYKTNATQNKSENTNLTEDEVTLAKEYEEYIEFNRLFTEAFNKEQNGEVLDDACGVLKDYKDRGKDFKNVFKAIGIQIFDTTVRDLTNRPTFNIPEGRTRIDVANNSLTLARGGRINVQNGYIYIAQNHVSVFSNDHKFNTNPDNVLTEKNLLADQLDSGYSGIIMSLIDAVDTKNVRFTEEATEKALKLLGEEMGLNTNKPMYINGVVFEVVNGRLQTKGYTEPEQYDGFSYLNNLLQKAYEQNII